MNAGHKKNIMYVWEQKQQNDREKAKQLNTKKSIIKW